MSASLRSIPTSNSTSPTPGAPAPLPATPGWMFAPKTPFRPAAGLGNAHSQTFFSYFTHPWRGPAVVRERWETADDDFLDVDRVMAPLDAPHVVLLHGLEGSSKSGYMLAMLRGAADRGWGAMAVNFRSCSGEMNRQLRSYNSGETQDPAFALEKLRERGVTGPLFGMGFSLGGNALLKLLAEQGDSSLLSAAVAVSAPFDLSACAHALDEDSRWGMFYRSFYLRPLHRKALRKAAAHPGVLDVPRIRRSWTFREFDDLVTAPLHGFKDAEDYWARCSSGPMLERIRRPTLLISSNDDPIAKVNGALDGLQNPYITSLLTQQGGHVGFVAGSILRPRFWAEEVALQFMEERAGVL